MSKFARRVAPKSVIQFYEQAIGRQYLKQTDTFQATIGRDNSLMPFFICLVDL